MSNRKKAAVTLAAFLCIVSAAAASFLGVIRAGLIEDNLEYRGYVTRYVLSLFRRVKADKNDLEARLQLADTLYDCGIYRESARLYGEVSASSTPPDLSLRDKQDRCMTWYKWMGGDKPDHTKIDVDQIKKLHSEAISDGIGFSIPL